MTERAILRRQGYHETYLTSLSKAHKRKEQQRQQQRRQKPGWQKQKSTRNKNRTHKKQWVTKKKLELSRCFWRKTKTGETSSRERRAGAGCPRHNHTLEQPTERQATPPEPDWCGTPTVFGLVPPASSAGVWIERAMVHDLKAQRCPRRGSEIVKRGYKSTWPGCCHD